VTSPFSSNSASPSSTQNAGSHGGAAGEGRDDAPGCLTHIVQDILAGFFIITECQYGFGDLIRLSVPSLPDPAIGTVEDVTLRVTTVRNADGEVVITPTARSPR